MQQENCCKKGLKIVQSYVIYSVEGLQITTLQTANMGKDTGLYPAFRFCIWIERGVRYGLLKSVLARALLYPDIPSTFLLIRIAVYAYPQERSARLAAT
jgi:hypothetical protein